MLKTLKTLVLLATISCGYTSNLNSINNLNNITNNNNIINNNLDNVISNNIESKNIESNTNKFLGKKRTSKKLVKKKNNAYKYLFNDYDNKYFRAVNGPVEVSNPKYKQFMKRLYDMFHHCLHELFFHYYNDNDGIKEIQPSKNIRVGTNKLKDIAEIFDEFKFADENSYVFANNNVANLNKYIKKHKNVLKDGIPFYNFYMNYLENHIDKLYYQTTNALRKSIDNHEQIDKQVEIINESHRILDDVLWEFINQIHIREDFYVKEDFGAKKYCLDECNEYKKYYCILNKIEDEVDTYYEIYLDNYLAEFNCYKYNIQDGLDDVHDNLAIDSLENLINNINDGTQNIIIDTTNDEELKRNNQELFDDLLENLDVEHYTEVIDCKDFLINGRKDITIKQYLTELIPNLDVLRDITQEKIQYQMENEYVVIFDDSLHCYNEIIRNVLNNIEEQCKKNEWLCKRLSIMSTFIDISRLCYEDYDTSFWKKHELRYD